MHLYKIISTFVVFFSILFETKLKTKFGTINYNKNYDEEA